MRDLVVPRLALPTGSNQHGPRALDRCGNTGSYFYQGPQMIENNMNGYSTDNVWTIRVETGGDVVVTKDGVEQARLVTPTINYPLHVAALINHAQDPAFINVKWIG